QTSHLLLQRVCGSLDDLPPADVSQYHTHTHTHTHHSHPGHSLLLNDTLELPLLPSHSSTSLFLRHSPPPSSPLSFSLPFGSLCRSLCSWFSLPLCLSLIRPSPPPSH